VAWLTSFTVASGTTAPWESVTVPLTSPVAVWLWSTGMHASTMTNKNAVAQVTLTQRIVSLLLTGVDVLDRFVELPGTPTVRERDILGESSTVRHC